MTSHPELANRLARHAAERSAPKRQRAITNGWRLAAVVAARKTGAHVPVRATTFWGDRLHVMLPEPLSCQVFAYHFFEEGLTAFMLSELGAGQRVYDVGAHYGYFTRLASRLVGPTGAVHSFEPTPRTFARLEQNTRDLENVTCNRAAVWHVTEMVRLKDFGASHSMFNSLMAPRLKDAEACPAIELDVQALSLDEYASKYGTPDFVKIDAESAEWSILRGMDDVLRERKPILTVEVGDYDVPGAPLSRTLLDYVIGLGYEPFQYHDGRIEPHALQESYEYDNILLRQQLW